MMRDVLKLGNDEIAKVFRDWNDGDLNRYVRIHIYVYIAYVCARAHTFL
jgi:6-phosphogluconate dehydrogenase